MQILNAPLVTSWDSTYQILLQPDHKWLDKQIGCREVNDTAPVTSLKKWTDKTNKHIFLDKNW